MVLFSYGWSGSCSKNTIALRIDPFYGDRHSDDSFVFADCKCRRKLGRFGKRDMYTILFRDIDPYSTPGS